MSVFSRRLTHAEKLVTHAMVDIQAFLNAHDESEMSNEQEAIDRLRKLLPKLAKFLGEV